MFPFVILLSGIWFFLKIKKSHDEKRNDLIKNIRIIINEADKKKKVFA